jgi:hypothetical protein
VDLLSEQRKLTAKEQLIWFMTRTAQFLRYHREYGIFFGMVAAESADSNERVAEALREKLAIYAAAAANIIAYGQKKGEFRKDLEPMQTAHSMIGGYIGLLLYQNLFRSTLNYDPMLATLDKLIITGFTPEKDKE